MKQCDGRQNSEGSTAGAEGIHKWSPNEFEKRLFSEEKRKGSFQDRSTTQNARLNLFQVLEQGRSDPYYGAHLEGKLFDQTDSGDAVAQMAKTLGKFTTNGDLRKPFSGTEKQV